MAEILYHKSGLLGPKTELHIAPEGLALVGKGGAERVEFAPLADVTGASATGSGRRCDLTVSFGASRPAWVLLGVPRASAEWAAALIDEEKSALAKRGMAEYTLPVPLDTLSADCQKMVTTGDGRAAVDLVDFLLVQAVLHRTSDLHFDPYGDSVVVRFRIDGTLRDVARLDSGIKRRLTSRLKVVSHLAVFRKSKMPMISTSDVSLKKPMKVLMSGGITTRSAWGRMISSVFCG